MMLTDQLKYRLPFEEIVTKSGAFKTTPFSDLRDGFVVANFDKSMAYYFQEDEVDVQVEVKHVHPICYSKETYLSKASDFIASIRARGLSKAIFSRVKPVDSEVSSEVFFDKLCEAYPSAFVYLISSNHFGTWIGATPESLISCNREWGHTVSLAGTKRSSDDSPWGEKEQFEQKFVTDFIEANLKDLSIQSIQKEGPHDRVAGPVKHLETRFQFSMDGQKPISVAEKLHPTPAVSGLPQKEAIQLINEVEDHDRQMYTGCIGILGERTDLFVNLRCAQVIDNTYFLYLGGGFTKDSIAQDEWQETENKSRTLLDILENS